MSDPTAQCPTAFALKIISQLLKAVREIAKQPGVKAFCGAFEGELSNIYNYLEDSMVEPGTPISESRLVKLLDYLQRICQWPTRGTTSTSRTFHVNRYPALKRLLMSYRWVLGVIKNFACDPNAMKGRETLLRTLKAFVKPSKRSTAIDLSELKPSGAVVQNDYQAHLRALYNSLAYNCLCDDGDGRKGITANLHLRDFGAPEELGDSASFRLFFLDHPHSERIHGSSQWQDSQISVKRKRNVTLDTEQETNRQLQKISTESFCQTISSRSRTRLELVILDDNLLLQEPGPLSDDFHLDSSSISLAKLLKNTKLGLKTRLLLSYYLSASFWQFYDSDWMQTEWTKDNVHFMFERRSDTPKGIFVNQPFLSARFGEDKEEPSQAENSGFRSHGLPKLLALGIMLLEIELNVKIEDHRKPQDLGPNSRPNVNADHFAAMDLFKQEKLWEEQETFPVVREVIEMCLIPDQFKPLINDTEGLRDAFKKNIVNSLHALYQPSWGDPDTSAVRPAILSASALSSLVTNQSLPHRITSQAASKCLDLMHELPQPRLSDHPFAIHNSHSTLNYENETVRSITRSSLRRLRGGVMSTSNSHVTSEDWFTKLDDVSFFLRPKPDDVDCTYTPVRIAILDTGVRHDSEAYVKDFKDFVDSSNLRCQDNTNHGTNAVFLVKKVYNQAEIYVARVFHGSQATSRTPSLMAAAIRHAVKTWEADIIVMPSGFSSEDTDLERAVDEARNARVLIFAAASNYGNIEHIAFPGRLYVHLRLFCMFSTDPNVRALPNFNPTASSKARHSFAILGEGIQLPQNTDQTLSGTSFATMIGGALAARILDFSRHKGICQSIRHVHRLRTVEGMSAIFEKMVNGTVDNGYHCMAPWKLLRPGSEDQEFAQERHLQRNYVCETISRALAGMHTS